jgi:hypothetical protein
MLAGGEDALRAQSIESEAVPIPRSTFLARAESPLVLLTFLVLTVAMTWPWTLHMAEAINPFGDVVLQMAVLRWDAHALATNPGALFEAPFFYPYAHSVAFSEHLVGETLITLPFLLLTGNPALSYNINLLLSFVLTGFFTYLLVRDLTGSRAGGLLAGVAFAFCPFRFMQMGHLHMMATAWFPFTLWALFRWSGLRGYTEPQEKGRSLGGIAWLLAAIGGFVAMGLSSVYYTFFLLLAVLLWAIWAGVAAVVTGEWRAWKQVSWRPVILVALGLALAGAILLPIFLPYAQTSDDLGVVRTTYELDNWSAQWSYFGKVLQSNWLYARLLAPNMATSLGERQLFFGIVPSILALLGLVWGRGGRRFYFALLGLFALAMTFGLSARLPGTDATVPLPYAFFYDFLPGFKALRVPVRFAVLLDFSIYVLAGYGLAMLVQRFAPAPQPQARPPLRFTSYVLRFAKPSLLTALATALVLLEFASPLDVTNRRDVTAQIATIEPYGWLSRPENAGPIVELPFNPDQADVEYMLFDTRNWQPLVNGWSGFVPPGTVELSKAMAAFPDPVTISLLQGLEVRHVVVHLWQFPKAAQAALKKRLDGTKELAPVDQAGDNYVYELAPNPWLRDLARQLGSDKTLWIGEARHGTMPTLEVLAYALNRLGVRWEQMGGYINIGYRPIGQLPFGTFPDYALVPNDPKLSNAELTPVGLDLGGEVMRNPAVRVLHSAGAGSIRSFDLLAPDAPAVDPSGVQMAFDENGIRFGAPPAQAGSAGNPAASTRDLDLYFVSFAPTTLTLKPGAPGQGLAPETTALPAGVSRVKAPVTFAQASLSWTPGDSRLVRVGLGPAGHDPGQPLTMTNLLPLEVSSSMPASTLDTRMRAIVPPGNGDLTATIDVYVEPWGTHPDGHYGSWSVVLPADGAAHDYTFHLDPLAKTVSTVRDGRPIETFSWIGPPTQGDFQASLVVSDKAGPVAQVPLYLFTIDGSRLADWQIDPPSMSITPVR